MTSRTVLFTSDHLAKLAEILTGYGAIKGIDHEGTITYEIESQDGDDFDLGLHVSEIQCELRAYDSSAEFTTAQARARAREAGRKSVRASRRTPRKRS